MQQYVNKFQIAINDTKTEVNLNFIQESPIIPMEDGNDGTIQTEIEFVSNLVMSYESAQKLHGLLDTILNEVKSK